LNERCAPRSGWARWTALGAAALVLSAGLALLQAHVRLLHPTTGNGLYWQSPQSISIVIQADGSKDLPDQSHFTALRNAIAAWNQAPGSVARLVEDTSPAQQARTDFQSSDIHLMLFDEDNSSGYFPAGSSVVAVTPIWFYSSGRIADADVLFNGLSFRFTTSKQAGRFDVQDVGTHELGHLLGLDHSGWAGASMFPYVDPTVILHRSLSADDIGGLRAVYPDGAFARFSGRVERSDGSPVRGAQVVAADPDGRPRGAILTGNDGQFLLPGLNPGSYRLYAAPLDGPVTAANLSGGQVVDTDFQPTAFTGLHPASAGATTALGTLAVLPNAAISLGRSFDRLPLRVIRGQTSVHSLRGSGLVVGSSLEVSDPSLTVQAQAWLGSAVSFRISVPADSPLGHVDLRAINPMGATSVLTAGLEITPPDPVVTTVTPSVGATGGGELITIAGANFRPGLRVVIGQGIYAEGQADGVELIDGNTLRLVTVPGGLGVAEVVVIDESGVEGRLADGFTFAALPQIESVFPAAGFAGGGTEVVLKGVDMAPGASVRIDGLPQPNVVWGGPQHLSFTTAVGAVGGPYVLEVENPGGEIAQAAFAFVAAPDPSVTAVDPPLGAAIGGDTVTLSGSGFVPGMQVWFGAAADTGAGGVAAEVTYLDENALLAVTPPASGGAVDLVVRNPHTGQAVAVPAGFQYQASKKSGGGGGGCHLGPAGGGPPSAALWMALLLAIAGLRALGLRRAGGPVSSPGRLRG
jgi:hypothetical protein